MLSQYRYRKHRFVSDRYNVHDYSIVTTPDKRLMDCTRSLGRLSNVNTLDSTHLTVKMLSTLIWLSWRRHVSRSSISGTRPLIMWTDPGTGIFILQVCSRSRPCSLQFLWSRFHHLLDILPFRFYYRDFHHSHLLLSILFIWKTHRMMISSVHVCRNHRLQGSSSNLLHKPKEKDRF